MEVFATDLVNPDFAGNAEGCRALGIRTDKGTELGDKMQKVLRNKGTALLEIITDPSLP